jgi:hypothetical protein
MPVIIPGLLEVMPCHGADASWLAEFCTIDGDGEFYSIIFHGRRLRYSHASTRNSKTVNGLRCLQGRRRFEGRDWQFLCATHHHGWRGWKALPLPSTSSLLAIRQPQVA